MGFIIIIFLDISLLSGKKRTRILKITADFLNINLKRVCTLLHKTWLVFLHNLLSSPSHNNVFENENNIMLKIKNESGKKGFSDHNQY